MSDYFIALKDNSGKRAVKKFFKDTDGEIQSDGYGRGWFFTMKRFDFAGFDGMCDSIIPFIKRKDVFLMRGGVVEGTDMKNTRRLKNVTVSEVQHRWVMLDYDSGRQDGWPDLLKDPEGGARKVMETLPFKGVKALWQLGNSAGINPKKYSYHIFLYLDDYITNKALKAFCSEYGFDNCIAEQIQPHYIGGPLCVGFNDPVGQRYGIIDGDECTPSKPFKDCFEVERLMEESKKREARARRANLKLNAPAYTGTFRYTTVAELLRNQFSHIITKEERGGWVKCDCPNHTSSSAMSLQINVESGQWNCHGCHESGGTAKQLALFLCGGDNDTAVRNLKGAIGK